MAHTLHALRSPCDRTPMSIDQKRLKFYAAFLRARGAPRPLARLDSLRSLAAVTLAILGLSCGGSSPAGPSSQPPAQNNPAPTLSTIAPAVGATSGGLTVTITGAGFVAGASVSIGGTPATGVAVASATSITAVTPARAAGAADIVVTNPDGQTGRLANGFNYETPVVAPPSVAVTAPDSGPASGGTSVTISGAGFASGATVAFGTTLATSVNVASASSIIAVSPAGNAGSVELVVTNPDGQTGRLARGFTYVASAPPPPPPPPSPVAPTLTAIAPTSGTSAGGTAVTLTGSGFAAGASVSIGGAPATNVVVASATSITAVTPAHTAGAVDVIVTNTDGQSARLNGGFTYTAPAPPPAPVAVITITSAGVSPSTLTITPGTRVRFVNNDSFPHDMTSDPHPVHTQCPQINQVGLLLAGQSRETAVFTAIATCGFHDHNDPDDPKWTGTILIR